LLLPSLAPAILGGCLFEVPLVERSEGNQPVFVDFRNVDPETIPKVYTADRRDPPRAFTIGPVVDPDVHDDLYAIWLLDYTNDRPGLVQDDYLEATAATRPVRNPPWSFELDPCSGLAGEKSSTALLECVVADRPFTSTPETVARHLPPEATFVQIAWQLLFVGECP